MADDPLGALLRFSAEGLFGKRRVEVEMSGEGITILTGANGTGKSTVLRAINAISAGDLRSFTELPLQSATLAFPKRKRIHVEKTPAGVTIALTGERTFEWKKKRRAPDRLSLVYSSSGGVFEIADPADPPSGRDREALPEWVNSLGRRFPVLYVTDQRLVVETATPRARQRQSGLVAIGDVADRTTTRAAVDDAAKDVASRIERAHSEYGLLSQRIDRDFADRLVTAMESDKAVSESQLRRLVARVEDRRNALQHVGLLPSDVGESKVVERRIDDRNVRAVVAAVHDDTLKKLAPLEELRLPLTLFLDFLNRHYAPRKRVLVDQEKGFIVVTEDGAEVPPAKLSSGEQQILVLAHHVLFRAQRGTTVLIDEPELSLHVTWQDTLLDDLRLMAEPRELAFLMATHSPTLLGGRKSVRRSLDFV